MQKTIITVAIFLTAAMTANAQSGSGTVVKIKDERGVKKAPVTADYYAECAKHKHHEVEVSRKQFKKDNNYEVTYYQKENDTMKRHKFSVGLDESYDKAGYTWDHDTVCVSFFNTESKKSKVYKGFGFGGTSSMLIDE